MSSAAPPVVDKVMTSKAGRTGLSAALAALRMATGVAPRLPGALFAQAEKRLGDLLDMGALTISSNTSASNESLISNYVTGLPQWQWFDATKRGYARATITPSTCNVDFMTVSTLTDVLTPATVNTSWRITDGTPGAVPA